MKNLENATEVTVEDVEPSEALKSNVEKGVQEAMSLLHERYENKTEGENNLAFHNTEHTKGVIKRTEEILKAIQEADPSLVSDHDIEIGRLAAAYHDTVQQWEGNKVKDGNFEKVLRKRLAGKNETASSDEAVSFMAKANENEVVFSDEDKVTVQRAIDTTVPGWDAKNKTVMQPGLKENSSLVERALALSDLATAGMGGPKEYLPEGKKLFREENLDILKALIGGEDIAYDKKEYFRKRMVDWLKSQPDFAKGRQERLETELKSIPEQARGAVAGLFSKFDASIKKSEEVAKKAEKMDFEELVNYMEYGLLK